MPEYKSMCCVGSRHLALLQPCQDRAHQVGSADCRAASLCDEAEGPGGGLAARAAAKAAAEHLASNFSRYLCEAEEIVRRETALAVYRALQKQALRLHMKPGLLRCTILAAAMDSSGSWLALNLGDGEIWSRDRPDDSWQLVSGGQCGLKGGTTCLTMGCSLSRHLRLYRSRGGQLLLLTDGAAELFRRLGKPDIATLETLFRREEPLAPDDYSFVWLSTHRETQPSRGDVP